MVDSEHRRLGEPGVPRRGGAPELVLLPANATAKDRGLPAARRGSGHPADPGRTPRHLWVPAILGILARRGLHANWKTVWRILQRRGWLSSTRQRTRRPGRLHEGRVSVPEPNRRWASDITSIKTWNGEKGRLAVIVDCADRSVVAWRWARRMPSQALQEMVREAVFRRFGTDRAQARGLEFLSDNGPEYACKRLRTVLQGFGMVVCRTPYRSPESNGLAEAFFGSFKRDYVYQGELESVEEVGRKLPRWIQDYNAVAPHSALGMKSPAQFYGDWMRLKLTHVPVQN